MVLFTCARCFRRPPASLPLMTGRELDHHTATHGDITDSRAMGQTRAGVAATQVMAQHNQWQVDRIRCALRGGGECDGAKVAGVRPRLFLLADVANVSFGIDFQSPEAHHVSSQLADITARVRERSPRPRTAPLMAAAAVHEPIVQFKAPVYDFLAAAVRGVPLQEGGEGDDGLSVRDELPLLSQLCTPRSAEIGDAVLMQLCSVIGSTVPAPKVVVVSRDRALQSSLVRLHGGGHVIQAPTLAALPAAVSTALGL